MYKDLRIVLGGGFIVALILIALFAPVISPFDPLEQDLLTATAEPFQEAGHYLGTDSLGRDVLSRLFYAARVALTVAFVAATLACLFGTVLGLAAGYFGGWWDKIISRLIDIWMAFPPVLLSILLVAILGTGIHSVITAIVVIDWTRFARVVRVETQQQSKLEYVEAATALGLGRYAILWQEILRNVLPVIIVLLSLEMGIAVIVEAILSFVGLSVSTDMPTWGGMIAEGRQIVYQAWWVLTFPLIALFMTVLAFNQLGDGLRNWLDPVLRR
jgi:ABC-type dipeptide/oligopeptide/nickel transport system permease subunit